MNAAVRLPAALAASLCVSCAIQSPARGEAYSWQVSGSYRDEATEFAAEARQQWWRVTYHLAAVDDAVGPYELAPFLNRSSYVAVGAGRTTLRDEAYPSLATVDFVDYDTPPGDPTDDFGFSSAETAVSANASHSGFDSADYAVDGRYVWPASGWYAGAHGQRSDSDAAIALPFLRTNSQFRRNGLSLGRYFGPRTAVEVNIVSESLSEEVRMSVVTNRDPLLFGPPRVEDWGHGLIVEYELGLVTKVETDIAAVSVRHVGELGNSKFEFSASVLASRSDARFSLHTLVALGTPSDWPAGYLAGPLPVLAHGETDASVRERRIGVSGALFPVDSLGVRLSVSTSDHDSRGNRDRVGLSAEWFFVRNAALGIELTRGRSPRGHAPDPRDAEALGVHLLGRF